MSDEPFKAGDQVLVRDVCRIRNRETWRRGQVMDFHLDRIRVLTKTGKCLDVRVDDLCPMDDPIVLLGELA